MSTTPPQEDQQLPSDSPYRDMEQHELIHLLDEINDERAKARFREAIYIALIVWFVFLAGLRYAPHFLGMRPRLIPPGVHRENETQSTMVEIPPEIVSRIPKMKPVPPKQMAPQESPSQAPTPATPSPEPKPAAPPPQPSNATPQHTAPQQTSPIAPQPQSQQQARLQPPSAPMIDRPQPSTTPTRPNFNTNMSAGEQIRQATRDSRRGSSDAVSRPPSGGSRLQSGARILTDTQGVDFNAFLKRLQSDLTRNWLPLIPEESRAPLYKSGITGIQVRIAKDGTIQKMDLVYSTQDTAINKAAWGSITSLGQSQPLPSAFKGPYIDLQIGFYLNKEPDVQ